MIVQFEFFQDVALFSHPANVRDHRLFLFHEGGTIQEQYARHSILVPPLVRLTAGVPNVQCGFPPALSMPLCVSTRFVVRLRTSKDKQRQVLISTFSFENEALYWTEGPG